MIVNMGSLGQGKADFLLGLLSESMTSSQQLGIIVHCHGFPGEDFRDSQWLHRFFIKYGYLCLSFNYPGLWGMPEHFTLTGALKSTIQALKYVRTKFTTLPIFLYGESFGALPALAAGVKLYSTIPITGIALRAPSPDPLRLHPQMRPIFRTVLEMLVQERIMILDLEKYLNDTQGWTDLSTEKNLVQLQKLDIPILVIAGKNDEVIPYQLISERYKPFTQFEEWKALSHNSISQEQWKKLIKSVIDFFQRII